MSAADIDQGVETLLAAETLLETLRALVYLRRCIDVEILRTVPLALRAHTGDETAAALGISRQQIYRRYANNKTRPGAVTPSRA